MNHPSTSERTRIREAGQRNLGAWITTATGQGLWSVQAAIALAVSKPRSKVAVPSCNASGKTWLAARIALAFFDAFTPGTPCYICKGPCGGSKIITTSSKFDHLRDNLWGEMRSVYPRLAERFALPGRMFEGENLRLEAAPNHYVVGHNPKAAESMQGYHQSHKLIIGDEATSLDEAMASGITGLMAAGDARLFLVANPTSTDTWFYKQAMAPDTQLVRIRAWDTPAFTGEEAPPGAALVTPDFLEWLKGQGMGPGTYEWQTRVEAEFWGIGEDSLVSEEWYDRARRPPTGGAVRQLGVDLATYGSAENIIAWREGNTLLKVEAFPSMKQEDFWAGPVVAAIKRFDPHYLVYDADGVGAGVSGEVERAARNMSPEATYMGFRGGMDISPNYHNARSAWWWALRKRFEADAIDVAFDDPRLREQLTDIRYRITEKGRIRVESKEEMRKRGKASPDRADGVMYAFAMSDVLPEPTPPSSVSQVEARYGLSDRSEDRMWQRDLERVGGQPVDPVWGTPANW